MVKDVLNRRTEKEDQDGQQSQEINNEYVLQKTCLKWQLKKKTKIGFQDQLLLNALLEHSAILSTFIKVPFVFKTFVLSFFLSGPFRQVLLVL